MDRGAGVREEMGPWPRGAYAAVPWSQRWGCSEGETALGPCGVSAI